MKIFNATTADLVLMDVRMPGEKMFTPATIKAHFHGSCLLATVCVERRRDYQPCPELRSHEIVGQGTAWFYFDSRN